ncbi:hypothetical protein TcCL_NonESM10175 [Trypanosoma cruzi]|nr:hypothetical protein TcCL_NonESM10175 [Trypanosoma cruzi]
MAECIIGEIVLKCGERHRTRRKQVRMMSLHVSRAVCQMENFGETEVSALTSTPGSFIRTVKSSIRGSTLVEGYCDHLTSPRACPHNVLLPFLPLHASAPSFKPHPGQIR